MLIHGFNSTPEATFGVKTDKDNPKQNKISTRIKSVIDGSLDNNGKPSIARSLIKALDPQGRLIGTTGFSAPDPQTSFKDFYRLSDVGLPDPARYFPSEEARSYDSINHCFVETYCSYYANESDDGDGIKFKNFRCDGGQSDYDLTNYYSNHFYRLGGQEQLVRIRIIQLLNEYYGDWKWVDDPTAKIKIVCHSNGGLVITKALEDDSCFWFEGHGYFDGNFDYYFSWWDPLSASTSGPQGSGFKLNDHIDQVITIDTPFKGSPWAGTKGKPTDISYMLTTPELSGVGSFVSATPRILNAFNIESGKWTQVLISLAAGTFYTAAAFTATNMGIVYDAMVGGSDSPLIHDLAEDGTVVKSLKGTKPPTFTDGRQVPYLNHIGVANNISALYTAGSVLTAIPAVYHTIMGCAFWWAFPKAAAEFTRAAVLLVCCRLD